MAAEFVFEVEVGYQVASGIVIEYAVEAYRLFGYYRGAEREFGLESPRCAYAHQSKRTYFVAYLACIEVDVSQGVEFVDYNVDIVRSDTVAEAHYGLAVICAAYGVEFARRYFKVLGVEEVGHHIYACRVAYQYHTVGKLFGQQVEVEYTAVGVDYHFRFRNNFFKFGFVAHGVYSDNVRSWFNYLM